MNQPSRIHRLAVIAGSAAAAFIAGISASSGSPVDASLDASFRGNIESHVQDANPSRHGPGQNTPGPDAEDLSRVTRTPIKHVILIIGENRTFDHLFATYQPRVRSFQTLAPFRG